MVGGTASRLANDEMLAVRGYLNEGGRLLYTGKYAGFQQAFAYEFNIETNAPCDPTSAADGCQPLSDDFQQYYLGAYLYNDEAGTTPEGTIYDVVGIDSPFGDALTLADRAAERRQPGPQRLVHPDQHAAAARHVAAVRRAGSRPSSTGSAGRSTRTPARTTCTRRSATSRTSA